MEDNSTSSGYIRRNVRGDKHTLLNCINKVLAAQFLKTMRTRMIPYESFDASPPPRILKGEKPETVRPISYPIDVAANNSML